MHVLLSLLAGALLVLNTPTGAVAQSVRDHVRLKPDGSTAVTESQASELTLTLTEAAVRPIQIWVRTAGVIDNSRRTVAAFVPSAERAFVKVGQRVRAFSVESRSSMYLARVAGIEPKGTGAMVTVTMAGPAHQNSVRYILEIVTERGDFLSVPNEAIIETDGRQVVYVQEQQGRYVPKEIQLGIQGELYTQVLSGLKHGEQVVTFGSFFIDAEHKLKGS
ncbi:MAG: HlyD family efflux transporter periplasmic adaptor subunit [Vicinamibacterales bacterium]